MSVLGFELSAAISLLEQKGFCVTVQEARSKKGLAGNEQRVIREQQLDDKRVCLTYAVFQTVIPTAQQG